MEKHGKSVMVSKPMIKEFKRCADLGFVGSSGKEGIKIIHPNPRIGM